MSMPIQKTKSRTSFWKISQAIVSPDNDSYRVIPKYLAELEGLISLPSHVTEKSVDFLKFVFLSQTEHIQVLPRCNESLLKVDLELPTDWHVPDFVHHFSPRKPAW